MTRNIRMFDARSLAGAAGVSLVLVLVAAGQAGGADRVRAEEGPAATVVEFGPDLIGSDNGLPVKPTAPLRYGPPAMMVDDHGNAVDAHQGKLASFGGRYWLYGDAYRCGYRFEIPGLPLPGRSGGFCGFATYTSADLERWHQQPLVLTPRLAELCVGGCVEPRVIYSPALRRYLMWFGAATGSSHYYVSRSVSPAGPWSDPIPATLAHPTAGDFDVYVDHQGRGWIVQAMLDFTNPANDALYIERLNTELTSGTGAQALVASGPREAPSLFQRGDTYHLMVSDPLCAYCQAGTGTYVADDPLGPWRTPGTSGDSTVDGPPSAIISEDSCGGQPRTVSELPTLHGTTYLAQVDLWRTSPEDFGPLGDRNQAVAGRYWFPLQFSADGTVEKYSCLGTVSVPLASGPTPRVAPTYELDCRANFGSIMQQRWTVPPGRTLSAVTVAVFQRPHDNADTTQPLRMQLLSAGHVIGERTLDPAQVSWAPHQESIPLRSPVPAGRSVAIRLTSDEQAGCYGGLVGTDPGLLDGSYSAGATPTTYPHAALLFRPSYTDIIATYRPAR